MTKPKKSIASFEDYLDEQAKSNYEQDLNDETKRILSFLRNLDTQTQLSGLIKVLVGKNIISEKDFKTILAED